MHEIQAIGRLVGPPRHRNPCQGTASSAFRPKQGLLSTTSWSASHNRANQKGLVVWFFVGACCTWQVCRSIPHWASWGSGLLILRTNSGDGWLGETRFFQPLASTAGLERRNSFIPLRLRKCSSFWLLAAREKLPRAKQWAKLCLSRNWFPYSKPENPLEPPPPRKNRHKRFSQTP